MLFLFVFDSKVVKDKAENDGVPFVFEQTQGCAWIDGILSHQGSSRGTC